MQKICIVVPCYNEEKRLDVAAFSSFITAHPDIDFVFIDDGSKDATFALIQKLEAQFSTQVKAIKQPENGGKAEAVRCGVMFASERKKYHYIGFWDADLSTPLNEIIRMSSLFSNDTKILMGSRINRLGAEIRRDYKRHILGRIFSTFSSLILDLPVYDSQCGAKLFEASLIQDLFGKTFITKWIFDVELLARYKSKVGKNTLMNTVIEVPLLKWEDVGGSKIKFTDFLKVPFELYKIKSQY